MAHDSYFANQSSRIALLIIIYNFKRNTPILLFLSSITTLGPFIRRIIGRVFQNTQTQSCINGRLRRDLGKTYLGKMRFIEEKVLRALLI